MVEVDYLDPIYPYFGGALGEECRTQIINEFKESGDPRVAQYEAIMETDLYKTAESYCGYAIEQYDSGARNLCLLEQQARDDGANFTSYIEYWGNPAILDGAYDLATMFTNLQYKNFTTAGLNTTCLADCYIAENGEPGCQDLAKYFPQSGRLVLNSSRCYTFSSGRLSLLSIPVENYCRFQWNLLDHGYNVMRSCASKAIGDPSNGSSRADMVAFFELESQSQQTCHYKYCQPAIPNETCPNEEGAKELFEEYEDTTGWERSVCGYTKPAGMKPGAVVGIVVACVAAVALAFAVMYYQRMKDQQRRFREYFVKTIARNISIEPSAGAMEAQKLADEFAHIDGNNDGKISKDEMRLWLKEGKMGTLSDSDFEALWGAIDMDGSGSVDAVEFFVFLSGCGDEFESVYKEQSKMTKEEKISFASQRLSKIAVGATAEEVDNAA